MQSTECRCRWDGNLDGKLIRCKEHAEKAKKEREAKKKADAYFKELTK